MKASVRPWTRLRTSIMSLPLFTVALPRLGNTLYQYALLMRLHRPIGIWLLMWPMLWALWIAGDGHPDQRLLVIFLLGALLMRSAGCIINDYADRDLDPFVKRTKDRPLAARRVSPNEALFLFAAVALVAVGLVFTLNPLAQLLAVAGAILAVTYPFMKRVFPLPQFYLGAAFGIAVPMAFAAQTGEVSRIGWVVFLATVVWAGVYDTLYAMVDREDDAKLGIKSTAILFADADRFIIGVMQLMVLVALFLVGRDLEFGQWYWAGLAAGALLFIWQQWLIRRREPERCFQAFNNNHYFGMVVFIGILLHYLFTS
ncbi:MAG TPA: 4-hydroxybenzoate octaprenyltransferase [Steroidobacteraceae bacterium]|nr:4-hydroxybenzoate octaprenyltransferase [Steroidobacteraceae bacterium]